MVDNKAKGYADRINPPVLIGGPAIKQEAIERINSGASATEEDGKMKKCEDIECIYYNNLFMGNCTKHHKLCECGRYTALTAQKDAVADVRCNDGLDCLAATKERVEKAGIERERIVYNMPRGEDQDVALQLLANYFLRDMLEIWKAN